MSIMRFNAGLALCSVLSALTLSVATMAAGPAAAQESVTVTISEYDLQTGALHPGDTIYMRLNYGSTTPLRIRAKGYFRGELLRSITNPSVIYPAGTGEALAWLSYRDPVRLDEIKLIAYDAAWQPISEFSRPLNVDWRKSARQTTGKSPEWVGALNETQLMMARQQSADDAGAREVNSNWAVALMGLSIPLYLLLQAAMAVRFRGAWRIAALVPAVGMVPVFAYTVFAFIAGSSIWPILLLLLTPFAAIYMTILATIRWLARAEPA